MNGQSGLLCCMAGKSAMAVEVEPVHPLRCLTLRVPKSISADSFDLPEDVRYNTFPRTKHSRTVPTVPRKDKRISLKTVGVQTDKVEESEPDSASSIRTDQHLKDTLFAFTLNRTSKETQTSHGKREQISNKVDLVSDSGTINETYGDQNDSIYDEFDASYNELYEDKEGIYQSIQSIQKSVQEKLGSSAENISTKTSPSSDSLCGQRNEPETSKSSKEGKKSPQSSGSSQDDVHPTASCSQVESCGSSCSHTDPGGVGLYQTVGAHLEKGAGGGQALTPGDETGTDGSMGELSFWLGRISQ